MTSAIIQNLKEEIEKQRLSVLELAKRAEVKPSFIYDILSGKSANPGTARLARVAETLGVSVTQLLGLADNPPALQTSGDYVLITSMLTTASARGGATVVEERQGEPYYFRRSWLRDRLKARPEDLRMVFVEGDGMEPTLRQGDMVLVDITKKRPSPPGIFVLFDGLGLAPKRLEFLPDSKPPSLRVLSDNPQYLPHERTLADTRIIGRVVWFAREI